MPFVIDTHYQEGIRVTFMKTCLRIAGLVFFPPNFVAKATYPAIVFTHPGGGMKEQVASLLESCSERLCDFGLRCLLSGRKRGHPAPSRGSHSPCGRHPCCHRLSDYPAVRGQRAHRRHGCLRWRRLHHERRADRDAHQGRGRCVRLECRHGSGMVFPSRARMPQCLLP